MRSVPAPKPRVLLVDDEDEVRRLVGRVLASAHFECVVAESVDRAWTLLEEGLRPDAILLDLRMPNGHGLPFLRRVRADPRYAAVPVGILTANSYIGYDTHAALAELNASVAFKPLFPEQIRELARSLVSGRGTASGS
jgi:CheY-like chemotaxis protein